MNVPRQPTPPLISAPHSPLAAPAPPLESHFDAMHDTMCTQYADIQRLEEENANKKIKLEMRADVIENKNARIEDMKNQLAAAAALAETARLAALAEVEDLRRARQAEVVQLRAELARKADEVNAMNAARAPQMPKESFVCALNPSRYAPVHLYLQYKTENIGDELKICIRQFKNVSGREGAEFLRHTKNGVFLSLNEYYSILRHAGSVFDVLTETYKIAVPADAYASAGLPAPPTEPSRWSAQSPSSSSSSSSSQSSGGGSGAGAQTPLPLSAARAGYSHRVLPFARGV